MALKIQLENFYITFLSNYFSVDIASIYLKLLWDVLYNILTRSMSQILINVLVYLSCYVEILEK